MDSQIVLSGGSTIFSFAVNTSSITLNSNATAEFKQDSLISNLQINGLSLVRFSRNSTIGQLVIKENGSLQIDNGISSSISSSFDWSGISKIFSTGTLEH